MNDFILRYIQGVEIYTLGHGRPAFADLLTLLRQHNIELVYDVRSASLGEDAGDLSSLENPQTVDEIRSANQQK